VTEAEQRARNIQTLEAAFAACTAGDVDTQLAHYTDDAVIEVVLSEPPGVYSGKATLRPLLEMAATKFPLQVHIDEVVACTDPDELVVEYHADGVVVATGKSYRKQYLGRFRFRDGAIARQREFFSPNAMRAALEPDAG
jgi:ketosteroid isomerase-like protein